MKATWKVLFHHAFCSLIGSKSQPLLVSSISCARFIYIVATIYLFIPNVMPGAPENTCIAS